MSFPTSYDIFNIKMETLLISPLFQIVTERIEFVRSRVLSRVPLNRFGMVLTVKIVSRTGSSFNPEKFRSFEEQCL